MDSPDHHPSDAALQPTPLQCDPPARYRSATRRFQGIPGIERAAGGRLWATWYAGGNGEGPDNYVLLVTSDDDGATWSEPVLVIDPPGRVRAFDPCLWHDPLGRLWLLWAQSLEWFDGRAGVWAVRCEDSVERSPVWSQPRRLCNGIMMNKPSVLSTGDWLLPAAIWDRQPHRPELVAERRSNVVCSTDRGQTWRLRGGAEVPHRSCDEHMIVQRADGSLWLLVRTSYGIGQSTSTDGGVTWSDGGPTGLKGPDARFFVRRLRSGRLLLVNHDTAQARSHLTAWLSEDDGRSWLGGLLLDERVGVSYPDGVEGEDGHLYVIYDRNRREEREILLAVFTEGDVLRGEAVSDGARLKALVNRPQ